MSGEFAAALADASHKAQERLNAELFAMLNGRSQPAEWVEDRRVRLTVSQAERGISPAKMTPLEWRRMNDASRAHSDAALYRSLQRALLGP